MYRADPQKRSQEEFLNFYRPSRDRRRSDKPCRYTYPFYFHHLFLPKLALSSTFYNLDFIALYHHQMIGVTERAHFIELAKSLEFGHMPLYPVHLSSEAYSFRSLFL